MRTIRDWMKEEGPTSFEEASLLSGYMTGVQFGHHLYDVHGVTDEQAKSQLVSGGETIPANMAALESMMAGAILRVGMTTEFMFWLGACHGIIMNGIEEFAAAQRERHARDANILKALTGLLGSAPQDDSFGLPVKPSGGLN